MKAMERIERELMIGYKKKKDIELPFALNNDVNYSVI